MLEEKLVMSSHVHRFYNGKVNIDYVTVIEILSFAECSQVGLWIQFSGTGYTV